MNDNTNKRSMNDSYEPTKDLRELLQKKGPEGVRKALESVEEWSADSGDENAGMEGVLPTVELPRPGRTLAVFAEEVGLHCGKGNVFSRLGRAVRLSEKGEIESLEPQHFRTWVEKWISLVKVRKDGDVRVEVPASMDIETSRAVVCSSQFVNGLRVINGVYASRLPVRRDSGRIELLRGGFDNERKVYTLDSAIGYREEMSLAEARQFMDGLLEEFPFSGERSIAVMIASMLTVFGALLLPEGSPFPCFVYQGNAEGSGKTTLALLACLIHGIAPVQPAPTSETEWAKCLLALALKGDPVAVFDNLRGHLSSGSLEAFITATVYTGRKLGASALVTAPANSVVMITANRLTVTPDMRRRALFVELFMKELHSEKRVFKRKLDPPAMLGLQPDLLAALWAVVKNWDDMGRPPASSINSSFPAWSEIVGGIVEAAGYACPTTKAELSDGGDTDTRDIEKLAEMMDADCRYKFPELVKLCGDSDLFERFTLDVDPLGAALTNRAKSGFAKVLKQFDQRVVAPGKTWVISGKGHKRHYAVVSA